MHIEPLEVYSCNSNYAVIKPPGRQFPGAVIQGYSLAGLVHLANAVARTVAEDRAKGDEFLDNIEELNNLLVGRLLHYQDVLKEHGIEYPHHPAISKDQLVDFFPDEDVNTVPNGPE